MFLKDKNSVCRTNENCTSLILRDKCNIEIFSSPGVYICSLRDYMLDFSNYIGQVSFCASKQFRI